VISWIAQWLQGYCEGHVTYCSFSKSNISVNTVHILSTGYFTGAKGFFRSFFVAIWVDDATWVADCVGYLEHLRGHHLWFRTLFFQPPSWSVSLTSQVSLPCVQPAGANRCIITEVLLVLVAYLLWSQLDNT